MKSKLYAYAALLLTFMLVLSCDDDAVTPPVVTGGFTASATTAKIGEEIQFTNTSSNSTAFTWSFGDGTTSKAIAPKKSYEAAGSYLVSLLSTGAGGSTISSTTITITPDPDIFFIENGTALIRRFPLNSTGDPATFLDISGFVGGGLTYDDVHQKIYFSDFETTGEGKIWSINLDGTDLKAIATDLADPYGIAVDPAGGKIYWADDADADDIGHIYRANLDGSGVVPIVTMDGVQFRAVALDPENAKMYFYDVWYEDLYVANIDGSDPEVIVPGVWGYAIAIDTKNDKIYFDDQNDEELKRADLDGSNIETVDDDGSRIYGIFVDNEADKLYWSGRDSGEISEANLDGTHKRALKSGLSSPRGMFLKK